MSSRRSRPYIALQVGDVYRVGHRYYRVAALTSRTEAELEWLAAEILPAHERSTPTHSYYRTRLLQPVRAFQRFDVVWTKTKGWRRGRQAHRLGTRLLDLSEEYESYSYCD
jgi:hypothetical protein